MERLLENVVKSVAFTKEKKHSNINLQNHCKAMLRQNLDENAALPVANFISFVLGLISLSALFLIESITVFLPLLFAPMVCLTLCYLLKVSYDNANKPDENATVNPIKLDLI